MSTDAQQTEIENWLRDRIDASQGALLGHGYQATVRRYASPWGNLVVKSPHQSRILGFIGKLAIRREFEVYDRLGEIEGVARVYGLIDSRHLVLQAVEGDSFRDRQSKLAHRERFFDQLLATLEDMHRAGVAHGDLKRKDNILVGPAERPYVIDFGVACVRHTGAGSWNRRRFQWFKQLDYNAWTKLKYGRNLNGISKEDAARYQPLWIESIARWLRIPWQTIALRRPRQRWRAGRK